MRLKSYLQSHKTYIIAEMSANHAGSLETALRLVVAAKEVGADCLKTQIYSADTLTIHCDRTPFKIHEGLWAGQTLYSLYEQASMPWDWHQAIQKKCREVGIDFLATAYDTRSVDYIISLDIPAIKIASFEIVDIPLIRYAAKSGKTMLLSCGMSSSEEIRNAVNTCFREGNHDVILLKCSSAYPADPSELNLNTIPNMKRVFHLPVGFSDHSLGTVSSVVACTLGACIIEKHFCLDKGQQTADSAFSLSPPEFSQLVRDIRLAEAARGVVSYGCTDAEKQSMIFRRSLFAVQDIKEGEQFSENNIKSIRPGYGLSPKYYDRIIAKKSPRFIHRGEPLTESDLEGNLT